VGRGKRPGRCADARLERVKWDMRDQGDCGADETNERSRLGKVLTRRIGKGRSFPPYFSLSSVRWSSPWRQQRCWQRGCSGLFVVIFGPGARAPLPTLLLLVDFRIRPPSLSCSVVLV
jgi:hypothetical protein